MAIGKFLSKAVSKTGQRFGEAAASVKNKADTGVGTVRHRSPNQDNANKMAVSLKSDVGASQKADVERIKKGLNAAVANPKNALAARTQQEAAGRAVARTGLRAGAGATALITGYSAGKGAGGEDDKPAKLVKPAERKAEAKKPETKKEEAKKPEAKKERVIASKKASMPERGVREGKNENIDDDVRKRALDSVKNLNKGGMVKKGKC